MSRLGWITNDPEIAEQLRAADRWHHHQRRLANRMAFDADRVKRAAAALGRKAETDRAQDYQTIMEGIRDGN